MFSVKKKRGTKKTKSKSLGAIHLGPSRARTTKKNRGRWWKDLRRSAYGYRPIAALTIGVLVAGGVYAAFAGGHVSRFGDSIAQGFDAQLQSMGVRVESIVLVGRKNSDIDAIKRAIALEHADSMLNVNTKVIRQRLLELGWVEEATVQRLLPNRINVTIVERKPFAVWQLNGTFRLVDSQGTIISGANAKLFSHLPLIVGKGANVHAAQLQDALAPYPEIRSRVRAAVRIGERRWNLRLASGVDVRLPEGALDRSLRELSILEAETRLLVRDIRALDLRFPDRLIIQTKDGALTELGQLSGKET